MKQILFKSVFPVLFIFVFIATAGKVAGQTVQTFAYTGAIQIFTVPSCVTTITMTVRGARGGTAGYTGGNGGSVKGIIQVSAGQVYTIYVGGQGSVTAGGYNGGGAGGVSPASSGGGGGGATDVRIGTNALANRIMVAAGGGGSGGSTSYNATAGGGGSGSTCSSPFGVGGGAGGGCATGANGGCAGGAAPNYGTGGGGGGLQSGGPTAGSSTGTFGGAGALGVGGTGGSYSQATFANGGGGGGAGYYGGAGGMSGSGGCNGGGGGGSSYANNSIFSSITFSAATETGNGSVVFEYNYNGTGVAAVAVPTVICNGSSATINGSGVVTYTWLPVSNFGGSNSPTIIVTPTVTTTYTVDGTNSLGCISRALLTVPVDQGLPVLNVANTSTATNGVCPGKTVTLTTTGATTYTYAGANNVTNGVSFIPTASSVYTVTGQNACGTSTAATSVSIHALPTVTAVISQPTICSGNSINITGIGNASSYSLSNGVQNGQNFFPTATAIYTVTGYSAQSCTATSVVGVTVVTTPAAAPIASPPLICIGNTSTLSSTGATNYTWTTPTGTFSTSSITVNPTSSTIYTLTKANANCVNTQTVNLTVNMLPSVFAIVTPTLICASRSATLQGGGAATYTWYSTSSPTMVTGASPIVSPSVSTMYTVTASDGTCVNTTTVFLAANPNPTITISPTSSVLCRGQSVTLTGNGAIGYTWTSVAGFPTTNVITDTPQTSTLYNLTGENNFSCTSTAQQVVIVNPTPTLNVFSNKPLVCAGAAAILTVTGAGTGGTYVWDANANNATTSVTTVNPLNTTVYSVTGFIAQTGCSSSKTIQVNVFLPTFAVNNPTSSCLGGMINLTASGAVSYTWLTQPNPQYFSQISVSPPSATVYVVAATSNSSGVNCISTQSIGVSIYANPTITAAPDRTLICKFETTNLNGYGGVSYQWSTSQTGSTVPVSPLVTTVYQVVGTDQNGCTGTTSYTLKVSTCFGLAEADLSNIGLLVYPNPSNGNFTIKSQADISLNIINELGQVVKTILLSSSNNNQCQISDLAAGVYFITGQKDNYPINEKIVVGK